MAETKSRNPLSRKRLAKSTIATLGIGTIFGMIWDDISSSDLIELQGDEQRNLRVQIDPSSGQITHDGVLHIPSSLDAATRRKLSINLGGGNCKWQPPEYDVPESIDFHKTLIAGFPSGDKRMIFVQMEALTGWSAKDEWDFEFLGRSNHPFIKANYPHHEGIWGWDDAADQVVMMTMISYGILDMQKHGRKPLNLDELYKERPPIEDFFAWRDLRVLEECHWYGWFIDYWMEGGLQRDIFTHKITTPQHWQMLMMPTVFTRAELDYDQVVGNETVVTPSYDPHCANGKISGGCQPVAVLSAEKLRDYTEGPAETTKIANVLLNDDRMGKFVIAQEAWDCIWQELIPRGKGLKTVYDRPGFDEEDYNFSAEMLEDMIHELDRLITKYNLPEWNTLETANRIVELLVEHRALIQVELNEVNSGVRKLGDRDFLGPKEREHRRLMKLEQEGKQDEVAGKDNHSEYFLAMEKRVKQNKIRELRQMANQKGREERIQARAERIVQKAMREAQEATDATSE